MAYIANKPIRFDRDYHIGEIIPETAIDPMMARKLTDMGKIICVTLPTEGGAEATPDSAGQPTDGAESTDGTNTQEATENAPEGQNEATEGGTDAEAEGAEADSTAEATPDSAGQPTDGAGDQGKFRHRKQGYSQIRQDAQDTAANHKTVQIDAVPVFAVKQSGTSHQNRKRHRPGQIPRCLGDAKPFLRKRGSPLAHRLLAGSRTYHHDQ